MSPEALLQQLSIYVIPLLFAITLHEAAHGWVACQFGDRTAKMLGRVTLNPIKHIDPIGTILVPGAMILLGNIIFGWAKPVPINERALYNPRRDMAIVAFAGPLANLLMAILWALVARVGMLVEASSDTLGYGLLSMGIAGVQINLILAILNMLPILPLDGGRIVSSFLPPRIAYHYSKTEDYGLYILVFLLITGILNQIMLPAFLYLRTLILNVFLAT